MSGPGVLFIFSATDWPLEMMPLPERVISEVTPPESATWIMGSSRSRCSTAFHSAVTGPGMRARLERSRAMWACASISPGITTSASYTRASAGASTDAPTASMTPPRIRISPS